MKRILLSTLALSVFALSFNAQTVVISEDFDAYTPGEGIALSSPNFTTWSGTGEGTTEDAPVTDAVANSGANSVLFQASAIAGGPTDIMVPLGYTDGSYEVSFDIRIASDSGAYFNIQDTSNPGDDWVIDVFMAGGTLNVVNDPGTNGGILVGDASYTSDTWHNVTIQFYHSAGLIVFYFDNALVASFDTTYNLGGVNFYAYGGTQVVGKFYIDNFSVTDNSELSIEAEKLELVQLTVSPNPSDDALTINLGADVSNALVDVISLTGSLVRSAKIVNASQHSFDVSDLQSGIYFVRVTHNGNILTRRLIIK